MISLQKLTRFLSAKEIPKSYYLTLLFETGIVSATVWELSGNRAEVLGQSIQYIERPIKEQGIAAANLAISSLETKYKDISKVVFGVPGEWVDNGSIKSEYTTFLKELSSELALKPVGFVVVSDAVSFCLSEEEGVPLTAILVHDLAKEVVVNVVKIGKSHGVIRKPKTTAVAEAVYEALREFNDREILPSRMLVFGEQSDLEKTKQELISYPWLSKISFLHFPKIDGLEKMTALKSVTYAGVSEIVKGDKIKFIWNETLPAAKPSTLADFSLNEINKEPEVVKEKNEEINIVSDSEKIESEAVQKTSEEDLGFVKNADILMQSDNLELVNDETFDLDKQIEENKTIEYKKPEINPVQTTEVIKKPLKINLPKIRITNVNFLANFNFISRFSDILGAKIGLAVIVLFLIILAVSGAVYANTLKATVILTVTPQVVEKTGDVLVGPQAQLIDQTKLIIPGKYVEVLETGSASAPTTGTKITGDKAIGEVTIYNKTGEGKLITKGTVITNSDNLQFTIDTTASVSAQTSVDNGGGVTITYGKQKFNVTAAAYGSKYNLNSGTGFKVGDTALSLMEAKNEQAFTKGSSREIPAVSKEDQDRLLKSLTEKLLEKGKEELKTKNSETDRVIDTSIETIINKKQYSKNVDEEAKDLTLNLEVKFKGLVYNDQDLKSLMEKGVVESLPEGYSYNQSEAENTVTPKDVKKDGNVSLNVKFKAKLLPKIDNDEIKKSLKGKSYDTGMKYLGLLKNVTSYTAEIKPKLPGFLYSFPLMPQNIAIEIKSQ